MNGSGQLGDGTLAGRVTTAVQSRSLSHAYAIAAGDRRSLAFAPSVTSESANSECSPNSLTLHNAAGRYGYGNGNGNGVTVLYFGDFDPSGEDMVRSLRERLDFFGCRPEIVKCALVYDDIAR